MKIKCSSCLLFNFPLHLSFSPSISSQYLIMSFTNVEAPVIIEPHGIYLPTPDKTRPTDTPTDVRGRTIPLVNISSAPNSQHISVLEPSGRESIGRDITEVDRLETIWSPYKNRYRVLAACITLLGNGMNDAATGTLIQSLER